MGVLGRIVELILMAFVLLNLFCFPYEYTEYLQDHFNHSFHNQCSKYPFVHQYLELLDNPGKKYVVFVFQESRLKNGGLGDRWAGLLSAMVFALRFNRILLVRSENHFGKFFRPFHSEASNRSGLEYTYEDWGGWTEYDKKWADHDETEYDLFDCINTTGLKNSHCSMDGGDVPQPVILYRANRVYLCRDMAMTHLQSHQDLAKLLGPNEKNVDLFMVAGCMLRLAIWPTDYLWREVDKAYDELTKHLPALNERAKHTRMRERRKLSIYSNLNRPYFQVGMHFRCGDMTYIHKDLDGRHCTYDAVAMNTTKQQLEEMGIYNTYMEFGSPTEIATCAVRVAQNQSAAFNSPLSDDSARAGPEAKMRRGLSHGQVIAAFVASDNAHASQLMVKLTSQGNASQVIAGSMLSPPGCHAEMTPSIDCLVTSVVYWFMLSLSDVIVAPTEGPEHYATTSSAFSRFASIYGLRKDGIRAARHCDSLTTTRTMAMRQNGNWFC